MKNVLIGLMLMGMLITTGCSMLSYSSAKRDYTQRIATERAIASGDQNLIKMAAQGNIVSMGIDLLNPVMWDVLAEHPIRAIAALAVDVAAASAATWAISSSIENSHNSSITITINITGNNNSMSYNEGAGTSDSDANEDSHNGE